MAKGIIPITGSFIPEGDDVYYNLTFGKTVERYLFCIEMDDASKTDLINEGIGGNRAYAFYGIYPKPTINGKSPSNNIATYLRYNANTDSATVGDAAYSLSDTQISMNVYYLASNAASSLISGYKYNYIIVPIDDI